METRIKIDKGEPIVLSGQKDFSQAQILAHYIFKTLPRVQKQLKYWEKRASVSPDPGLRQQALASIKHKAFHCQGGAVFAVPYPHNEVLLLRLIIAYQTICDYLDNLCDRAGNTDGEAFLQLHQSLIDALTPGNNYADYYSQYPMYDDGGYLLELVKECRACIEELPSYKTVYKDTIRLVNYYIKLQVTKHISLDKREDTLRKWVNENLSVYPELLWQEFAAASGSTLALFTLFGLAARSDTDEKLCQQTVNAYFPWICGLHILLDYFIDRQEDREGGDLNFTFYYKDAEEMMDRLKLFIREAHKCAALLPTSTFDRTVVEGLLATYLSDKKVKQQGYNIMARELLAESGPSAVKTYRLCSIVRKFL